MKTLGLVGFWRYRVDNYRIIASIEDDELLILAINIDHAPTADLPGAEALDDELAGAVDRCQLLVRQRLRGAALDEGEHHGGIHVRSKRQHLVVHAATRPIGTYLTARAIKLLM